MARDRRVATPESGKPAVFRPGDLVREFARRNGWDLGRCNLMLEGTTDVSYCQLADNHYFQQTGKRLIDEEFHVFAVGKGSAGGTEGVKENLRTLQCILQSEPEPLQIRVVCVFDHDHAGRKAFSQLKQKFREWGELFLLQRITPRVTRDPTQFYKTWLRENKHWKNLDCEIEDLVSRDLLDYFVSENPSSVRRPCLEIGGKHHFEFEGHCKGIVARFVERESSFENVVDVIEFLKSFRWLMKLDPEGS